MSIGLLSNQVMESNILGVASSIYSNNSEKKVIDFLIKF